MKTKEMNVQEYETPKASVIEIEIDGIVCQSEGGADGTVDPWGTE